jgi:iron uptake system component EfeO
MKCNASTLLVAGGLLGALSMAACSSDPDTSGGTDPPYRQQVTTGMQASMLTDINGLLQGAKAIQAAAPVTLGRGWDKTRDSTAIEAMKTAWKDTRSAYERIEGAIAQIFPDIDRPIDERYDGFLAYLGPDPYLFDDQIVTGQHAVERILFSDVIPQAVIDFESTLTGYQPAAFPATEEEASDFKNKLCARMVADAQTIHDQWAPQRIDLGFAFKGLIGLVNEQGEKVNKASSGQEESRYSQRTMTDLHDNLAGTKAIYQLFRPWLTSKTSAVDPSQDGKQIDQAIDQGFTSLATLYAQVSGDAIPAPPATWDATNPTAADLATPFGRLYTGVNEAVDPHRSGSVVDEMNNAARILGLPVFIPE